MVPVIIGAIGIGIAADAGIVAVVQKLIRYFKDKKNNSEELDAAREEIIQGIKEYDATHPDNEETDAADNVQLEG